MYLHWDYNGLEREVVSGNYSGLQRVIHNYREGYIVLNIVLESGLESTAKGSSLRRLLRTLESNTELNREIHCNKWSLNCD